MAAQVRDSSGNTETVKAPGTLVISAYAPCPDITKVITPDIKRPGLSRLLYIDLGNRKNRLGGTALAQVYNQIGNEAPDVEDPKLLKRAFNAVQELIEKDMVLSGHDRSDGGLITTLLEMAFAGNCGIDIEVGSQKSEARSEEVMAILFSEELGFIIEYLPENEKDIFSEFEKENVPYQIIGNTTTEKKIVIKINGKQVIDEEMVSLREIWEETSYQLEKLQINPECAEEERINNIDRQGPDYILSFEPAKTPDSLLESAVKPKVAVIREEGSNSDREMSSVFYQAGFEVWDVTMTDLLENKITLADFRGIAFVGGFSYADVLDSAKGWAGVIKFNKKVREEFQDFYNRQDTFSLGVCNGCQLMALLGWIPKQGIDDKKQPRFIHNISGRFESRFSTVKILQSNAVLLKGMEGSVLGIWAAHGEGRAYFPDKEVLGEVEENGMAPIRYVDDNNEITSKYPFNPNGSSRGIAALSSPDGRHLAIMPHPERTFLKWQWGWMPEEWRNKLAASPWLKIFQNAREWCEER
jgi:phosphoribosylformylglycinamidine synthase